MNQITFDFSFATVLDILSISTALMLGLLFMTSKTNNRKANVFLGLFLWSLSVEVLGAFIENVEIEIIQTSLFTIPLLFLYIITTLNKEFKWLYYLLFIPGFLLNFYATDTPFLHYFEYIFNISLLIFILKIVQKHQEKVVDFYSDIENKTLK